jgi:translation initiation factor RLI1
VYFWKNNKGAGENQMPKKVALVDFRKCRPQACADGVCVAVRLCPSRLIQQEEPFSVPMTEPFACRACGECTRACPQQAINIVSQ